MPRGARRQGSQGLTLEMSAAVHPCRGPARPWAEEGLPLPFSRGFPSVTALPSRAVAGLGLFQALSELRFLAHRSAGGWAYRLGEVTRRLRDLALFGKVCFWFPLCWQGSHTGCLSHHFHQGFSQLPRPVLMGPQFSSYWPWGGHLTGTVPIRVLATPQEALGMVHGPPASHSSPEFRCLPAGKVTLNSANGPTE